MTLSYTTMESPVGTLLVVGGSDRLHRLHFQSGPLPLAPAPSWEQTTRGLKRPLQQLERYFNGRLTHFALDLAPEGTPFQRKVWNALATIPYGETISYGELARRVRRPSASRAVGAANRANPLPIVLPCHRVVGASGKLVGFGGGLDVKRALLRLEGCSLPSVWQ